MASYAQVQTFSKNLQNCCMSEENKTFSSSGEKFVTVGHMYMVLYSLTQASK